MCGIYVSLVLQDVADEPAEDEPTVRLTGGIDLTQLRDGETFEVQEESFQGLSITGEGSCMKQASA